MRKNFFFISYFKLLLFILNTNIVFGIIPHPDHVVVLVLENHCYSQLVGSPAAPYINGLINDSKTATFTQSFGLARPSQPNYLQLFSGSTQGVTNNLVPSGLPFQTPNLGATLIANSKTFIGYSEGLPSVGYTGEASGLYVRKHNPWVNWQGAGINGIPSTTNQPFTAFPTNFNLLPSVSFVVPDLVNGMHDGTDPSRITIADNWIQSNLNSYIQWAKTNNSLFILTLDEGDQTINQHILTMFTGRDVQPGNYSNLIDHYNILRLLEDIFYLPHSGAAATANPIDYCWNACTQPASFSANGPLTFCQGSSVTLTASSGVSYLWSNGLTTQSILVSSSGSFSVAITDTFNCTAITASKEVTVNSFVTNATVFTESMGTVSVNTSIATHETNNGFDNDNLTMSGTGEVRASSPSSGYTGSSAAGNFYLTNIVGRSAIISNINTTGLNNLQLSFGIFKSSTTASGSDLFVQVSSDGVNYSSLTFPSLPTGSGTAAWYYRTATGSIPSVSNLRIRFLQNGTASQFRIDDVKIEYSNTSPLITAGGSTSFCQGGSVTLNASAASFYNWSNGASTQNISVSTSGNYYVVETALNGCTATSNVITVSVTPSATPSVSISSNMGNSVCSGTNVTFTAVPVNGGTTPAFQWKKNGINTGTNNNMYSINNLNNGDFVSCVLTSNLNCASPVSASSNTINMIVIANVTPSISINANPGNLFCPGTQIIFTATPVNGGSTPAYQWKKNGNNVGTNSNSYSFNSFANNDNVNCILTSNQVCLTTSTANSNVITMNLVQAPANVTFNPTTAPVGSSITINGMNFISVTSVLFNGVNASFSTINNTQITATVPSGSVNGLISVSTMCGTGNSSGAFTLLPGTPVLNLKLFIEGYYLGAGLMAAVLGPNICDTITLELRNSFAPFSVFYNTKGTINTAGNGVFNLNGSVYGKPLYISAYNHNSLSTWSSGPINFGMTNSYDFTLSASSAFGNNLKIMADGKYAFYSGDVTHDGQIDISDVSEVSNSIRYFQIGYNDSDLNGDKIVESADFSLVENNSTPVFSLFP